MKHSMSQNEILDLTAGYALGALTQREAKAFDDHLADGCESCRAELESFDTVVADLGVAVVPRDPPESVLDVLMVQTSVPQADKGVPSPLAEGLLSVRFGDGDWQPIAEGISAKVLSVDRASGVVMSMVRMAAGTKLPEHTHHGIEQFLVLEGDCIVNGDVLGRGDYHRAEPGTVHQLTYTENGTLLLLLTPDSYDFAYRDERALE
jgi:putative transcriptional regulator